MTTREMNWREAILTVLQKAEEPLDYNEITRQIGEGGLRTLSGATPATTVNRTLGLLIQNLEAKRTGKGLYALPEIAQRSDEEEDAENTAEDAAAVEAVADPNKLTIKAYGLYWDRAEVDWTPTNGLLWGQQEENASPVNFSDQDGIYLLHSWNEVVYVGQTFTRKGQAGLYGRLRDHHTDPAKRKSDRWDSFSWFGFKPVNDSGQLLNSPTNGNLASVIDVVEAMFIEALMPRLNMQTGRGSKLLRETGLYFQSSFQRVSRGFR